MSKILISLEDMPNGTVKMVSEPGFADIMEMMCIEKRSLTAAEGYAMHVLTIIHNEKNKKSNKIKLKLPRFFGRG